MKFHDPLVFLLFLFVLPALFFSPRKSHNPGLRFSQGELFAGLRETFRITIVRNTFILRCLSVVLVVAALARPQLIREETKIVKEGIDIVLAIDVSTSMLAEDFYRPGAKENRLDVAKEVMKQFFRTRENDRMGMVVFGSRSYPVCPLTFDHDWLLENLQRVEIGMVEDGTAIGSGLLAALNSLRRSAARSRVIILLTDGRNNAGAVTGDTAAGAAKALGVKIYAVGIGSRGVARYPVRDPFGRTVYRTADADLDEAKLKAIAAQAGGRYFRATDRETLRDIASAIGALEKTRAEEKVYHHHQELFPLFLLAALFFLFLEVLLKNTVLRTTPVC